MKLKQKNKKKDILEAKGIIKHLKTIVSIRSEDLKKKKSKKKETENI